MTTDPRRVTDILQRLNLSDADQAEEFLRLVYAELRSIAQRYLHKEAVGHTLQSAELVHEAFLKLSRGKPISWESRAHFYGVAARTMRQILVDHARSRGAEKRGGNLERVTLDTGLVGAEDGSAEILDLHDALERLTAMDERMGRLVELRFFTGLSLEEAARVLGVSRRTAAKDWSVARLWLKRELAA